MQVNDIINSLNVIAEKLFKSVESDVYKALDKITTINTDILKEEPLKYIFSPNEINGIIIIANAFITFYIIYYIFTELLSLYNGNKSENIYLFIIKIVIIAILVNNSYFICEQILNLFEAFTIGIDNLTKSLIGKNINFESLKESILSIKDFMKSDLISLDGLIKGIISFGAVSILINFCVRYVTTIFLLIISPFALVSLSDNLTSGFFKTWLKLLITNLFTQVVVKLLLLIPLIYKDKNNILYKIILVGTIYVLYKVNSFVKDIFAKISTEKHITNIFR